MSNYPLNMFYAIESAGAMTTIFFAVSDLQYNDAAGASYTFTLGSPQDTTNIHNATFPDTETAIAYLTPFAFTAMLANMNLLGISGLTFTQGNLVTSPEPLQSALNVLASKQVRTTTPLTGVSVVTSTSGGGTQISATKDSTVHLTLNDSITTSVGGTSTETLIVETAATNSTTAGDWTEVERVSDGQSITLAIALQSVNPGSRMVAFDLPAGNYFRVRETGAGTHSGSVGAGQKTIYG